MMNLRELNDLLESKRELITEWMEENESKFLYQYMAA